MNAKADADRLGTPSYFTCPACSATLWEYQEGDMLRYRCRVGPAFSMDSMEAEHADVLERTMCGRRFERWTRRRI
jgi:two-component system chemotaxis response regulator CheB